MSCFSLAPEETLLQSVPLVWNVAFEDLKPADLVCRIRAFRIVRVASEKPILDTLYDYVAHVVCSGGICKVPL
jgi:hypothetical protein